MTTVTLELPDLMIIRVARRAAERALTKKETEAVRTSVVRGRPFGTEAWQESTAKRLGLGSTFRARGRPKKQRSDEQTQ